MCKSKFLKYFLQCSMIIFFLFLPAFSFLCLFSFFILLLLFLFLFSYQNVEEKFTQIGKAVVDAPM